MRYLTIFMVVILITACGSNPKPKTSQNEASDKEYLVKGAEIATASQAELLKNVSAAMKSGGPTHAIEFCNLKATSLVDSLSEANNCRIRRISFKYRNPADEPQTETEKTQLVAFQEAIEGGEEPGPVIHQFEDRMEYYQAITINNGACLLCHGDPGSQIAEETLTKIRELYPGDLATGYALKEFRGAWQITFDR